MEQIKIYWGKRLDFEQKCCEGHNEYGVFITAVEFSNEYPYGKAIALLDMKSKLIKVLNNSFDKIKIFFCANVVIGIIGL